MGAERLDATPLFDRLPNLEVFASTPAALTAERIRDAEFVLVNKVKLDREQLLAAARLRFIGLAATGTDNVDLQEAQRRDIVVSNTREYCTQSVVEHVFGTLLTLAHSTHHYLRDVRGGAWRRSDQFCLLDHPIRELSSLCLGIVGYGTLGRATAEMARRFGMQVLVARRRGEPARADDGRVDFDDLLQQADVVSLHCPLNESTDNMIGAAELRRMRSSSFLINTARGGLVDSAALHDALAGGVIAGAAIDVLPTEPPQAGDPLLDYDGDNLLLTPHIAWATERARQTAIDQLAANIAAFQDGAPRNRVA